MCASMLAAVGERGWARSLVWDSEQSNSWLEPCGHLEYGAGAFLCMLWVCVSMCQAEHFADTSMRYAWNWAVLWLWLSSSVTGAAHPVSYPCKEGMVPLRRQNGLQCKNFLHPISFSPLWVWGRFPLSHHSRHTQCGRALLTRQAVCQQGSSSDCVWMGFCCCKSKLVQLLFVNAKLNSLSLLFSQLVEVPDGKPTWSSGSVTWFCYNGYVNMIFIHCSRLLWTIFCSNLSNPSLGCT